MEALQDKSGTAEVTKRGYSVAGVKTMNGMDGMAYNTVLRHHGVKVADVVLLLNLRCKEVDDG